MEIKFGIGFLRPKETQSKALYLSSIILKLEHLKKMAE
jgi:hypothetical protein